jgi:hypothetical protein
MDLQRVDLADPQSPVVGHFAGDVGVADEGIIADGLLWHLSKAKN